MKKTLTTTLPQMQYACGNDELRPAMNHVLVNKENFVASNANILVVHKTEDYFSKEFVDNLPEGNILIHRLDWAEIAKKAKFRFFDKERNLIKVMRGERFLFFDYKVDGISFTYPAWEKAWPEEKSEAVENIGLKLSLFTKLSKALKYDFDNSKLSFNGVMSPIIISKPDCNSKALIMPCIIND